MSLWDPGEEKRTTVLARLASSTKDAEMIKVFPVYRFQINGFPACFGGDFSSLEELFC